MSNSKIEWTEKTWNPITGCTKISPGCQNCYAEKMAKRLKGRFGYSDIVDPFSITFHQDKLEQPIRWKKHRRIFVCSMGDLFHENVQFSWARVVFRIMLQASHHTYMILTKRPEKMKRFYNDLKYHDDFGSMGSLDHIWLGVTAENQEEADKRIPILLDIPAAVHFVSVEPMLEAVDLEKYLGRYFCVACGWKGDNPHTEMLGSATRFTVFHWCPKCMTAIEGDDSGGLTHPSLGWVIIGAESGPKARKIPAQTAYNLVKQCTEADVPVFLKQLWGYKCEEDAYLDRDSLLKMPRLGGRVWDQMPGSFLSRRI